MFRRRLFLLVAIASLAACGGGGAGGDDGGGGTPDLGSGPPVANAGPDQVVFEDTTAQLDASRSVDTGGVGALQYQWVFRTGPSEPTLSDPTSPTPTFTAERFASLSSYLFEVTVRDNEGFESTDQVSVNVERTPPEQTLLGTVTFDRVPLSAASNGLDYPRTSQQPANQLRVDLLDSGGNLVDTTETDANGVYRFTVQPNQQRRVRVRAATARSGGIGLPAWDVQVVDNTQSGALYVLDGALASTGSSNSVRNLNAGSGWTGMAYTEPRAAGPFAILDSILDAINDVAAVDADVVFPALVVNWSVNNRPAGAQPNLATGDVVTSFYMRINNVSNLVILGAANGDTDEYDAHIVVHEWGHFFEDRLSRSDSVGGPHGRGDRLDMRVAFGEGFGNALAGMITGDPIYRDSFGNGQQSGFSINVESGNDPSVGWYSEASVQELLYDIFDVTNDAADSDSVSLGLGAIYDTLTNADYVSNPAFTSVYPFFATLRNLRPSNQSQFDQLLAAQNISNGAGLDIFGSNETNNAGEAEVLPIYTDLSLGSNSQICSINDFGTPNKLSNWRFGRFPVNAPGSYTFTLTGAPDPDFVVQRNGAVITNAVSPEANSESATVNLESGLYVLAMAAFENTGGSPAGTYCLTLDIQVN